MNPYLTTALVLAPAAIGYALYRKQRCGPRFSASHPGRAAAVGDSLTAHGEYLRQLNARLPGYTWENHGVVGQSTAAMLNRAPRWAVPEYGEILILGGINDLSPSRDAAWTIRNLEEMYRRAKAARARVVAVTMTPWAGYSRWTEDKQRKENEVNRWMLSQKGRSVDAVVNAYTPLEDPQRPGHLNPAYAARDKLHLSLAGQRKLADEIIRQAYA